MLCLLYLFGNPFDIRLPSHEHNNVDRCLSIYRLPRCVGCGCLECRFCSVKVALVVRAAGEGVCFCSRRS